MNGFEIIVSEISLVLGAIVLVFWFSYSYMLYHQRKAGTVRKDWWLSMIFYVGIGMLVLANMFLVATPLYETPYGHTLSLIFQMVAMLVFVYGFYQRMQHTLVLEELMEDRSKKKKGRR